MPIDLSMGLGKKHPERYCDTSTGALFQLIDKLQYLLAE